MRFGYCICYHGPRKVIRQRGFPCRGLLLSLSSDILIFFSPNIRQEMRCESSHMPPLVIIYLFRSIQALCDALGAGIPAHPFSPHQPHGPCGGTQLVGCSPPAPHRWGLSHGSELWAFPAGGRTLSPSLLQVEQIWLGREANPALLYPF